MPTSDKRIALLLFLLLLVPFAYNYGYGIASQQHVDFPCFYVAATLAFEQRVSPYDYEVFSRQWEETVTGFPIRYTYPPPNLLMVYPLTLLPYQAAQTLFLILNLLFFLILIWLVFAIGQWPLGSLFGLFAIGYMFAYYPVTSVLRSGQINLLVIVLLGLSWYLYKRGKSDILVAASLALAILLKTYPALFLLYYLLKRRMKIVLYALGIIALVSAATYLVLPSHLWSDWVTQILLQSTVGDKPIAGILLGASDWENQTIHGFTARLFGESGFHGLLDMGPTAAKVSAYALCALAVGIVSVLYYRSGKKAHSSAVVDDEFALGLLTMLLISPISWIAQLVFALPAALIAIHRAQQENSRLVTGVVSLSSLVLAWRVPFIATSAAFRQGPLLLAVSVYFYAEVCLWVYFAVRIWRSLNRLPSEEGPETGRAEMQHRPA